MSSLSLDASIRTCKVSTGEANRIESDRFLNSANAICIPWNGQDNTGRVVCRDSYYTKRPGCNSALDLVSVESELRPDYSAYMNLNMPAIQGDFYGNETAWENSGEANNWQKSRNLISGSFGNQFQSTNRKTCSLGSYENAMARSQQDKRQASFANNAFLQTEYRNCGPY